MAFAAQQQQQIRSGNSHQKQQQQQHRNGSNKPTRALPQLHIIVVTVVSFLAGSIWSSLFHHVSCIPTSSSSLLSAQSAFSLTDAALIEEEVKLRVSQGKIIDYVWSGRTTLIVVGVVGMLALVS